MESLIASLAAYYEYTKKCLVITGSGGKTSLIIALARYWANRGNKVLVSTTTKMEVPGVRNYGMDTYFYDESILGYEPAPQEKVFYGLEAGAKVTSPPLAKLEKLLDLYDVVLLEGDGSAHLGLKLHSDRDPVVPSFATATLAIFAFSLLGKDLASNLHCPATQDLVGFDNPISLATYSELLEHSQGITKGLLPDSVILANQAELSTEDDQQVLAAEYPDLNLWFGSIKADILFKRNHP